MKYVQIKNTTDADIPYLVSVHSLPKISKFISISDNYWNYITTEEKVSYFKIYSENTLVGTVHTELNSNSLYLSILIFPEHQNKGYGTAAIRDIKSGVLPCKFDRIKVSIATDNTDSIRLFEKSGFVCKSQDDGLLNFVYDCR